MNIRYLDICAGRFGSPDLCAEDYFPTGQYMYCAGNPVMFTDPTGMSTDVIQNDDGTFSVIGGDLNDKDLNIYVCVVVDGETRRLWSIGTTPVISSFYNSDANNGQGAWMIGAKINPNDNSGLNFIQDIVTNTPTNLYYALNGYDGQLYDFKASNGTSTKDDDYSKSIDHYRGVKIGYNPEGTPIYTSARDLGNIAAGYVSGFNGLPWGCCRFFFDALQSIKDKGISTEGFSSQNAQIYGHKWGMNQLKKYLNNSVPNVFPYSLFKAKK